MTDIALLEGAGPVGPPLLGVRNGVSASLVEKLIGRLSHAGIIKGLRGPGGGYVLTRHPGCVSVADIVLAVDEWAAEDVVKAVCTASASMSMTADLWDGLTMHMLKFMKGVTLEELVNGRRSTQAAQETTPGRRARSPSSRIARPWAQNSSQRSGNAS